MAKKSFLILLFAQLAIAESGKWPSQLSEGAGPLIGSFKGNAGIYVKDLSTGTEYEINGDKTFYLASGIKFLIAIEVLRKVQNQELSLDKIIRVSKSDLRDVSTPLMTDKVGKTVTISYLLERMLIDSDNMASDILISQVGLENLNKTIKDIAPSGLNPVTTLLDVRRKAFSEIHAAANRLSGTDFIQIYKSGTPDGRLEIFGKLTKIPKKKWLTKNFSEAFERYYAKGANSGTLRAYGNVLEKLVSGSLLDPDETTLLLGIMKRCETGENRIKALLPKGKFHFAHKTGTQYARLCDQGILTYNNNGVSKNVILGICVAKYAAKSSAEKLVRELTQKVLASGIFEEEPVKAQPSPADSPSNLELTETAQDLRPLDN